MSQSRENADKAGKSRMGEVVEVHFNKEAREAARNLARLLGILAEFEGDLLANPKKYLDMAAARVVAAQKAVNDLYTIIHEWSLPSLKNFDPSEPPELVPIQGIMIDQRRYDAMMKAEQLITNLWNDFPKTQ